MLTTRPTDIREAGVQYLGLGHSIIPLKNERVPDVYCGRPISGDVRAQWAMKAPYGPIKEFRTTPITVKEWHRRCDEYPDMMIGLATGKINDITLLDFDSPEALSAYKCEYDLRVEDTLTAKTGRGLHVIYAAGNHERGQITGVCDKVDMKGEPNIMVVEPSIHQNGKMYTWQGDKNPLTCTREELSDIIFDETPHIQTIIDEYNKKKGSDKASKKGHKGRRDLDALLHTPKGERNVTCTSYAGTLIHQGLDKQNTRFALINWSERLSAPMTGVDIDKCLNSVWGKDQKAKASAKPSICEAILKQTTQIYPGGDSKYKMDLIDGSHVIVDVDKLDSQPRMLKAMFIATGIRYTKVKTDDFYDHLCLLNDNADQKMMPAENGELGRIYDLIVDMIYEANRKPVSEEDKEDQKEAATKALENGLVIKGDLFYVKKKLLLKTISEDGVKAKRPDVLGWLHGNGVQDTRQVKVYGRNLKVMVGHVVSFSE